jgi:hypothetical protein
MTEVITGEFSRYRSNLIDAHLLMQVVLWDVGPSAPVPPERPEAPRGKDGDLEFEIAKIDAREQIAEYGTEVQRYKRDRDEFEHWHTRNGGPIEIQMWSVDARDALGHDARAVREGRQSKLRYHLSSKTRGYGHLENGGLPPGVTPGHGHEANVQRQLADAHALAIARRNDPVFGDVE